MNTYPNQKVVSYFDYAECSDTEHYAKINIEAQQVACNDLKPTALIIWLYLSKNTHEKSKKYKEALSYASLKMWGIKSDKSYREAVKELIAKGYLEQTGGNTYIFHQMPIDVEICDIIESKIYRGQRQNLPEYAVKSTGETLQDITKTTNAAKPRMDAVKITEPQSNIHKIEKYIPEYDWEE